MEAQNLTKDRKHLTAASSQTQANASSWEVRFLWLLVLILLGYWGYGQIKDRVDPGVQKHVLKILRQRYPQHIVMLQSAHVIEGKSVVLDGLRLALPTETGPVDIVRIGRITALGDLSLLNVIQGQLSINEVKIDDLTVSVFPLDERQWSIQSLANSGLLPETLPPVTINSGIVRLLSDMQGTEEIICHDLKARCRLNQNDSNLQQTPYELQAKVRSNAFDLVSIYVNISRDKAEWNASGNVLNCRFTQEFAKKLPPAAQASLSQLAGFGGEVSSTFTLQKPRDGELDFEVKGNIVNGSLIHPRLPYPLERLAGRLYCRKDVLQLRDAKASSGNASFVMNADVYGADAETPIVLELQVQNLPVDQRLYQVLTPKLKEIWNRLEPDGLADGTVRLQYDGARWRPEIEADIKDGKIRFASFPFPVSQIRGHISCSDRYVRTSSMKGLAGGVETSLVLLMDKQTGFWSYDASITTANPIAIDEELLKSLSPRGSIPSERERFVRSLHPNGYVQVKQARFVRSSFDKPAQQSLDLEISDGSISYDRFRYPVFGIRGEIAVRNGEVLIESLRGHNDSGQIRCSGATVCNGTSMQSLKLVFDATAVPVEEELRLALPAGTRQLWDALQPSGVVDHVGIELLQESPDRPLDITVTIEEQPNVAANARSVSIRPKEIPYPLTDIRCQIGYRNGLAHIERISGVHDVSLLSATGDFSIEADGTWMGVVRWLPESRLIVDQSLLSCLPGYLQQPILSTAFRGPVSLMGETKFASSPDGRSLVMRECDLELAVEEGRLGWGEIASGIRGSVHVVGSYDGVAIQAIGELNLDSLSIYQVPVLNLRGPFALRDGNIFLGRDSTPIIEQLAASRSRPSPFQFASQKRELAMVPEVPAQNAAPIAANSTAPRVDPNFLRPADDPKLATDPSDIIATCFGGQLYLHGVHEIATARSRLGLQLNEGDLRETLMDFSRSGDGVNGKYWAECSIQGVLHNQQSLVGYGQAWLRRADLVQMPVMTRLFRALSIKDPKSGAFESGELKFRIDGDRIPFDKISLDGDIISLRGDGWVNMRREVDLDLYAYVGKRSVVAAVLGPIVSHNDNASLMAVEVDGTLEAMDVRRSFKLLNTNAAELFPERLFEAP